MKSQCAKYLSILSIIILLILPVSAFGQNFGLNDGSKSLQFRIISDFSLSSMDGVSFSGKWHFSDFRALRLGIGLSGSISNDERNSLDKTDHYEYFSYEYTNTDNNMNMQGFNLASYYVFYAPVKHRTSIYYGLGPAFSFSRNYSKRISTSTTELDYYGDSTIVEDSSIDILYSTTKTLSAGISNVLGVEIFVAENISFMAEYGINIMYSWMYEHTNFDEYPRRQYPRVSKRNNNEFRIDSNPVKLGVSIYF